MPTIDSNDITKWNDPAIANLFVNKNYLSQFSEVVTRRLRRQLQSYKQKEPDYKHTLVRMESIALFYLESALDSDNERESTGLYHECAILFENLSYLYLEDDLAQPDSSELSGQRFIISALSYFLAGYEANAIVMTKDFLNDNRLGKNVVNTICALLIGKQL